MEDFVFYSGEPKTMADLRDFLVATRGKNLVLLNADEVSNLEDYDKYVDFSDKDAVAKAALGPEKWELEPKYMAYELLDGNPVKEIKMKRKAFVTPYLDELIQFTELHDRCAGVWICAKGVPKEEHDLAYMEGLLETTLKIYDTMTLRQIREGNVSVCRLKNLPEDSAR